MTAEEQIARLEEQLTHILEQLRLKDEQLQQAQEQLRVAQARIEELEKQKTPPAPFVKANVVKPKAEANNMWSIMAGAVTVAPGEKPRWT